MSNFEMKPLIYGDSVHGGTGSLKVATGETKTTNCFHLSHEDSIYGIVAEFIGTRYGDAITLQLQQAPKPTGPWSDINSSLTLGTGGTSGTPASLDQVEAFVPASGTFYPYARFKIAIAAADTSLTLTDVTRSARGLK